MRVVVREFRNINCCFMTTLMFYLVPVYHVRAVAGQQARLPCDISLVSDEEDDLSDPGVDSPPLDGESSLASGTNIRDAVLLVLWYRDDLGTPIYRYMTISIHIHNICIRYNVITIYN